MDVYEALERAVTLLKAAEELLRRQSESTIVLDLCSELVHYDKADCDGYCLLEDIQAFYECELEDCIDNEYIDEFRKIFEQSYTPTKEGKDEV